MRALVTGARGFIGSFLVESLLEKGYEVTCLLRKKKTGAGWLTGLDYRLIEGDIGDVDRVREAVRNMDYVFHLAGITKASQVADFERVNVGGTRNVLNAVVEVNPGLKKLILVSSLAAAGPSSDGHPVRESDAARPVSAYGRSKLAAERMVLEVAPEIPVTILRPPPVYGPRDQDIFAIFKQCKQGWLPEISGGPRYVSMIYVHDLVRGILLAAQSEAANGQTYFLCDDRAHNWQDMENRIAEILNVRLRRIKIPLSLAFVTAAISHLFGRLTGRATLLNLDKFKELQPTHWLCSSAKAQNELGFEAEVEIESGLKLAADWYKERGWL